MKEVTKIEDFTSVITGGTPSTQNQEYWVGGTIPWLNSGELNQDIVTFSSNFITSEGLKHSAARLMPPDTVLIALTGATTGKIGYLTFEACASQSVTGILPSENHHPKYLYYYLNSIRKKVLNDTYGGAQPHISQGYVKNIRVPLPPLSTQKKIAAILDKADELRQNDKKILEKYDRLAQSVFLEMFGDPFRNERTWNYLEIKSLGKVITGSTPPSAKMNMFGGNIPFVTPGDLDRNEPYKRFVTIEGAENSRIVTEGALFVCCIGATIGKIRLAKETCAFNQQINAIQWNERVNPYYGLNAFQFVRKEVVNRAISTTLPILKKSEFEKIKMAVPPIILQMQFGGIMKQIDLQKKLTEQSLRKSEELFQSLLQRAFKGELW